MPQSIMGRKSKHKKERMYTLVHTLVQVITLQLMTGRSMQIKLAPHHGTNTTKNINMRKRIQQFEMLMFV